MKKLILIFLILLLLFTFIPIHFSLSEDITPPQCFSFSNNYQRIPVLLNSSTYYAYEIEKTDGNTHTVGWLIVDSNNKTVSDKSTYEKLALAATVTKYLKENPTVPTIMEADMKMLSEVKWKMALNEVAQSIIKTVSSYLGTMTGSAPMGAFEEAVGMASILPQAIATELSDAYLDEYTKWMGDTLTDILIKTGEINGALDSGPNFLKFTGVLDSIMKKGALISAKKGIDSYSAAYNILKNHTGPWSYDDAKDFLEGYTKGKAQAVAYSSWYLRLIHGDKNWYWTIGLNVWDNVIKQVLPEEIKAPVDASIKFGELFSELIKKDPTVFSYNQVLKDIQDMSMLLGILRLSYNTSLADSPANRTYEAIVASLTGALSISSTPSGAKVYINNNFKGLTPLNIKLNTGNYTVKITKDGYKDYSITIKVETGKIKEVKVYLSDSEFVLNTVPIWATFHYNAERTGQSPYDTSKNTGFMKWKFKLGSAIDSSPVIASDGTVYIGTNWMEGDHYLYAVSPNGTLKWKFKTNGTIASIPSIGSDGTIYVGSTQDAYLYAIDPNGKLKWKFRTGPVTASPALSTDNTIYVESLSFGYIYAIKSDGTLRWKFKIINGPEGKAEEVPTTSSPAIGKDGTIYVGSDDHCLYAISPDGTLKWKYMTGDCVISSPAIGNDGTIYVGSLDGNLYAINPDGSLQWRFKTGRGIESSPAISFDGTIYIGSWDGFLYAISSGGCMKWKFSANDAIGSSPVIGADGTIFVGSKDSYVYAINQNGTLKWKFKTGDEVWSSPAISLDGTVYIGSWDCYLYAIGGS